MNSAAVAEKRVGHYPLLRLIYLSAYDDDVAGLQDDERSGGRICRFEILPIATSLRWPGSRLE